MLPASLSVNGTLDPHFGQSISNGASPNKDSNFKSEIVSLPYKIINYFFLGLAWARSEAATDFSVLVDVLLLKTFEAFEATFEEVCLGFVAIIYRLLSGDSILQSNVKTFNNIQYYIFMKTDGGDRYICIYVLNLLLYLSRI